MRHRPDHSPLPWEASQLGASLSSSHPGPGGGRSPTLMRVSPLAVEGAAPSPRGGTRPKKGQAQRKLFSPRIPASHWRAGWHGQTHKSNHACVSQPSPTRQHPNSPSRRATVKTVTPRKLANDVPPNFLLSKGQAASTLLPASHKSVRSEFQSFPGRGSPGFGEEGPSSGHGSGPFHCIPNILTPL